MTLDGCRRCGDAGIAHNAPRVVHASSRKQLVPPVLFGAIQQPINALAEVAEMLAIARDHGADAQARGDERAAVRRCVGNCECLDGMAATPREIQRSGFVRLG